MRVEWIAAQETQDVEVSAAQREIAEHPPKLPGRELLRTAHIFRREIFLAKLPCRGLDMLIRRLAEPDRPSPAHEHHLVGYYRSRHFHKVDFARPRRSLQN